MIQHYLYPLALIAFALTLSRTPLRRFTRYVPLLIVPWVLGIALKGGYLSSFRTDAAVFFITPTPLQGGSEEFALYRRFQTLSRFFKFPSVSFIERNFVDDNRLFSWQSGLPSGSIALKIHDDVFDVSMPLYSESALNGDSTIEKIVGDFELDKYGRQFIFLSNEMGGSELLLGMPARTVSISAKSSEQTLHFIGWLGKVSMSWVWNTPLNEENRLAAIAELQRIEDSAAQLHMLSGWNNNAAKMVCRLVQGNVMLLEALLQGGNNQELIERASRRYASAQKLIKRTHIPELESVLRNNFAVSRFLMADSKKDRQKSRKEFLKAISSDRGLKEPSIGSRLALINLSQAAL